MVGDKEVDSIDSIGEKQFQLRLIGAFGLFLHDGNPIPIRHLKNQALLVLLAVAPGQERTRRWLEATLWSDRQAKEAGQSLRTALGALRLALGGATSPVNSNRASIWLAQGTVLPDVCERALTAADPEILEGLDIRDEAFNDWLVQFRAEKNATRSASSTAVAASTSVRLAPQVVGRIAAQSTRFEEHVSQQVLDLVDKTLSDAIGTGIARVHPGHETGQGTFVLRSSVVEHSGRARLSVRLEDPVTATRLWSGTATIPADLATIEKSSDVLKMVFGTSSVIIDAVRHATANHKPAKASSEALLSRAIVEMFSFDASRLQIAEGLLRAASGGLPKPLLLAWEALLHQFKHAEMNAEARPFHKKNAIAAAEEAVNAASENSQVLSIAGIVRQFLGGSADVGYALGERAVFLNPSNAFAYAGLGIACLRQGKVREGAALIDRAEHLASHSVFLHWIQMFRCLSAIMLEDYETAIRRGESASSRVRSFRSPLRHLYALHLHRRDENNAMRVLSRLHRIEPGFSMKMIRDTPDYPVPTLRNSPLIDVADLEPDARGTVLLSP